MIIWNNFLKLSVCMLFDIIIIIFFSHDMFTNYNKYDYEIKNIAFMIYIIFTAFISVLTIILVLTIPIYIKTVPMTFPF